MSLLQEFSSLTPSKNQSAVSGVFIQLGTRYAAPARSYHNWSHILSGLETYQLHNSTKLSALEFMAWLYHDAVYDSRNSENNEERSAMVFYRDNQILGFDYSDAEKITELILTTKHTGATNIVTDMDLAGLGSSPEQFDRNGENIRKEYSFVPDEVWRRGRGEFLRAFLDRAYQGTLYHTNNFKAAYTKQAQENLQRALLELS